MQRASGGSYVCWRCMSRRLQPTPSLVTRPFHAAGSRALNALRAHGARTLATVQESVAEPNARARRLSFREQLQEWVRKNQIDAPQPMIVDAPEPGKAHNSLTRPHTVDEEATLAAAGLDAAADQPLAQLADRDGALDYLPAPTVSQPGDLVEFTASGHGGLPLVAICLGYSNGCYHFYTATGKWYPVATIKTRFFYRHFASEAEVRPVMQRLPKERLSLDALQELARSDMGPDRATAALLLFKLHQFQRDSDAVLQRYATRFEQAHHIVSEGLDDSQRCLTMEQIQFRLLHERDVTPEAPVHVMYAVYRTISTDDVGFRFVGTLGDSSTTWLVEVTPREDVTLLHNMQTLVRLFTDIPGRVGASLSSLTNSQLRESQLGHFILKAREVIDRSRQCRDWTPHGMLGPARQPMPDRATNWTGVDMSIMHFMLLWAGYDQFSLASRYHWIGSAILRATVRYTDAEYLTASTAWTFLQELGYLTPWDLHDRYVDRVPGVQLSRERGFAPFPLGPEGIRPYLTKDVLHGRRHDWASLKAFAIDSKDTVDVDDAVSVEATDAPDQHWLHIHVADPASRVRHHNALAERASLTPMTLYLPGHYSNMWGVEGELQNRFSLAPGRPCLTFSGLVRDDGELLEHKITPGKLQEFVYMTPQDANTAVGADSVGEQNPARFIVGKPPEEKPTSRTMTVPSDLPQEDRKSLKTLYRLADAVRRKRLAKGAMPKWTQRPSVKAFFDNTSVAYTRSGLLNCNGDPTIELSWDSHESAMVSSTMVLAGEIAAKWSAERNIPMPYLSQPGAEKNNHLLKRYTEEIFYPILQRGEQPDNEEFGRLRTLLGPDELSTTPAPHFLMGVDMYMKVTSPLRRYSDLVAHWQIENALAQEMETGRVDEAKLPFVRQDLDQHVFPWLRLRQQIIRRLGNSAGLEAYRLQALVRAWKYPMVMDGEAGKLGKLPDTFHLSIQKAQIRSPSSLRVMKGALDWFGLEAWMVPQGLGPLGLCVADVRKGDVFKVKLIDVDVHLGRVYVEAVSKVNVQKDGEAHGAQ